MILKIISTLLRRKNELNKITQITRRDITDIIRSGFIGKTTVVKTDYYEKEYFEDEDQECKMCYHGRLSETDFLSRIYNLKTMPSNDPRYKNAEGDIWQHTINNDDWDAYWIFEDSRFKLVDGEDEFLLNFICEMFNPIVRKESEPWRKFLEMFNELLKFDGYEIYPINHISGKEIYSWRETNEESISIPFNESPVNYQYKSIGEGSYAKVYKYKDEFYNDTFVVKRAKDDLDEKELERFKIEYEQLKKLNSPYIVKVYGYNSEKNEYTMEFMDYTLDEYINKNNGKLAFGDRKNIVLQVLRAFKYIHSKSLLHRDVCPKNVLIKEYENTNVIKISDFGLVKIPNSDLTSANTEYKGYFNDPELRLTGFSSYCVLHETYSITRLIFFIMTGRVNTEKIENLTIKDFIFKGLSTDKLKRYQDIEEMIKAFSLVKEDDK